MTQMTQMMQEPLPPGEPIPPGFGPATQPWVWKVTYVVIGAGVGSIIMTCAIVFSVERHKKADMERQCWDPPPAARTWAYPKVSGSVDREGRPFICARRADNNKGVIPHSHRCLRMVPCEDKR